ncbi:hypothetical protein GCM10007907_04130 [Chitinimonas prasina]|uniref:CYTH domain-containing protein n=1 Tax=Chitinimonas prasina TaxID=1434937 RepID=A0ABQ5YAY0_9NEIS|nr:hypothetical protein [Chitinimonas prasina]GLR11623.1 hypothetical protein GCM10007907_04130 [Chitinimonas prasina]
MLRITVLTLAACCATAAPASREYKMIVDPTAYEAYEPSEISFVIERSLLNLAKGPINLETRGKTSRDKTRAVRFLDTPGDCLLTKAGLIVRDRGNEKKRTLTIKLRGDVDGSWTKGAKVKEEEDVVPPLQIKQSRALQAKLESSATLDTIKSLQSYLPELERLGIPADKAVQPVIKESIREETFTLPEIKLGNSWAETELSMWYFGDEERPALIEASFRYEMDGNAEANEATAKVAAQWFKLWQSPSGLTPDPVESTKTAFVFKRSADFCKK